MRQEFEKISFGSIRGRKLSRVTFLLLLFFFSLFSFFLHFYLSLSLSLTHTLSLEYLTTRIRYKVVVATVVPIR